ncbi:DUF2946 domain-containing protein [Pseudenterobacter timonensis]|uniref:DUF2946 domain-containing protein n=1 Tax=Pseudenterobacter timonensis TaxID=1755099 RepID=A0AAE4DRF7_9ENTR|nr:DUF2946 domain-containing protein [Pseudenterobacter timonensis]MDR9891663.1 DUF2946 domain-containing protein [Pseudenterobacter timonensis]
MINPLHQRLWKRAAAWAALFAILLIVVAPLISVSLQKDPMSGMHHEMSGMSMSEHHSDPASLPADHAEACGYCVLLAHVPGLMLALTLVLYALLQRLRIRPPRRIAGVWRFSPWLLPTPRAPPGPSAFLL